MQMSQQRMVYCNEKLISADEPLIFAHDRGFLLADGIFETIRLYQGKALQFDQHWQRLTGSAQFLDINVPVTRKRMRQAMQQLLTANGLATADAGLRITLSRGIDKRSLWPVASKQATLLIDTFALPTAPAAGFTLIFAAIKRNHLSPLANIKSLNYLDNILARREAINAGGDDAILLNVAGNVAETSTANIFIVTNNTVITPPLSDGALPGIARATILQLCQQMAITIEERSININDLKDADEVFVSNALLQIHPVQAIDDVNFNSNVVSRQLHLAYQAHVGQTLSTHPLDCQ